MKTAAFLLPLLLLTCVGLSQAQPAVPENRLNLIPQPVSMKKLPGEFKFNATTAIRVPPSQPEIKKAAELFAEMIAVPTGFQCNIQESSSGTPRQNDINLLISPPSATSTPREGYSLEVTPRSVQIKASAPAGFFYGLQTLLQLLPKEIESAANQPHAKWQIPCVQIVDYPRFGWRGLLLDVSRHFFPKESVMKYIDQMARYKFNTFHWHLTDDNGWRIEIKSLPQLTQVGAWRVPRLGRWGEIEPPQAGESATYGGYYTQEEIREIIDFARERNVTIVPEIELPGHALAALASYPELSCTGGPFQVNPGSDFYQKEDNAFCPGNEKTFEFFDQVFTEVAALFPSEYIHIGGDECYKGFWERCPKCQKRIADEHLKDLNELQSYLVKRVEKILKSKGKKLIGWDEILEGGLAPEATVMSWRGVEGGIAAAKMNHQVVMTPNNFTYIDLYQGDPSLEPDTYSKLLLSKAYSFEPVPQGIDPRFILGGQGNLWTESVPTLRHAEYMTWPRSLALAEVYWSPAEKKNWDDFIRRMEAHFERLEAGRVNFSRSVYDVKIEPSKNAAGKVLLKLFTEINDCEIYYTFDGTNPDNFLPKYSHQTIEIPRGAHILKAVAYRDGKPMGRMLSLPAAELTKRAQRGEE